MIVVSLVFVSGGSALPLHLLPVVEFGLWRETVLCKRNLTSGIGCVVEICPNRSRRGSGQ